jgi:hypothetical protein
MEGRKSNPAIAGKETLIQRKSLYETGALRLINSLEEG